MLKVIYQRLRRLHSQVKTPTEYISEAYISSIVETYQTDASGYGGGKRAKDVHSWGQPLSQSLIATARFVELSNFILKDSKEVGSGLARLQLRGNWMYDKVFLSLLLVGFNRSLEDSLET